MGRIQTTCHSTWRYLLGPFMWFEWANPGWDPSHKTLFRFHFTEKDNRNMHLNLLSLQRQILINVSFRLGKIGLYYRTYITGHILRQYIPASKHHLFIYFISDVINLCFLFHFTTVSKSFLMQSFPICHKCDFTVTYTRLIRSGHLCPAVMFSQDQLYSDPWKWEVQHWWGKKRDRDFFCVCVDSLHHYFRCFSCFPTNICQYKNIIIHK